MVSLVSVLLIAMSARSPVLAQAPGSNSPPNESGIGDDEPEFAATVRDTLEGAHRFKVPRNRSIVIETSLPLTRADVVGRDMIRVETPSPTQLLVTGEN